MQVERATAVVEVLPIEPHQIQDVGVTHHHIGRVLQLLSGTEPAFAEVPVFRRGERKRLVEPAQTQEILARHDEIIAGEEPPSRRVVTEILVEVVDDALTRGGVHVVREDVHRLTTDGACPCRRGRPAVDGG